MKNFIALMLLTFNVFAQNSRTQFFETWSTKKANQTLVLTPTGTGVVNIETGLKIESSPVTINTILDEDNMVSDSATAIATQQSIKAYVDSQGGGSSATVCFIKDVKSNNTAGGTATLGGFVTRDINTSSGDCTFLSISSNQFTLDAGTYNFICFAPAHFVNIHKAKIRNITDGADVTDLIGSSERADDAASSVATNTSSKIIGSVTIASTKTFELQHRVSRTQATNGFGIPSNFSLNEVYSQCQITKI